MPRKKMPKICATDGCDEEAREAGLCHACYQWHWNWTNKGVAAQQRYLKKQKRIRARIRDKFPDKADMTASRTRPLASRSHAGNRHAYVM